MKRKLVSLEEMFPHLNPGMKITRRAAGRTIAITTLAPLALMPLAGFKSCGGTPEEREQLARMVETGGAAMVIVLHTLGQEDLARRYQQNVAFVAQTIRAWAPGGSTVEVIRHINDLIDQLKGVPGLDRFLPVVNFWLGTLAHIIEVLQAKGAGGEKPHTEVRLTKPPEDAEEFKRGWDAVRDASRLEQAPVL